MSYKKHTWVDNETLTASKFNHMEDGVEACINDENFFINIVDDVENETVTLDKNYTEIVTAIESGYFPIVMETSDGINRLMYVTSYSVSGGVIPKSLAAVLTPSLVYSVSVGSIIFTSDSATGVLTNTANSGGGIEK